MSGLDRVAWNQSDGAGWRAMWLDSTRVVWVSDLLSDPPPRSEAERVTDDGEIIMLEAKMAAHRNKR